MASDLTQREKIMLDIMRVRWPNHGARETAIMDRLGISALAFFQELAALIETERAVAYDPLTVNRLRRLREQRRAKTTIQSPSRPRVAPDGQHPLPSDHPANN